MQSGGRKWSSLTSLYIFIFVYIVWSFVIIEPIPVFRQIYIMVTNEA